MKRREFIGLSTVAMTGALAATLSIQQAGNMASDNRKMNPKKQLAPNTKWLRETKWGLFTHYLAHMSSTPVTENMTGKLWNKKVDSFQEKNRV